MPKYPIFIIALLVLVCFTVLPLYRAASVKGKSPDFKQISISISLNSATYDRFMSWIKPFDDLVTLLLF
jgi:hypothetical protein